MTAGQPSPILGIDDSDDKILELSGDGRFEGSLALLPSDDFGSDILFIRDGF